MNKKIYLIFSIFFFLKSNNEQNNKITKISHNNKKKLSSEKSNEEIVFDLLQRLLEQDKNNDLLIVRFISRQKYGAEKIIKVGIATVLSYSQIKLEEVPDKIVLKPVSLSAFLIFSSFQDILTEIISYSTSDFKEMFKKSREISKNPQKHKEILSKFYQGDFSQLQYTLPEKHAQRLSNSKNYKKTISDLKPYSAILIDLIIFLSQNNKQDITDEEVDAINELLNKRFKGKFYEKLSKVNQSLEKLKQEVQKDDFQDSSRFFELLWNQLFNKIKLNIDKKLENTNTSVNTLNLSTSDKKEIIKNIIEAIYVVIEEIQPNNIENLIKKNKQML